MAVDIPPEIDLSLIFERDDVMEAFGGHCCRTHLDDAAVRACSYCAALRLVLADAILEWKAICDAGALPQRTTDLSDKLIAEANKLDGRNFAKKVVPLLRE